MFITYLICRGTTRTKMGIAFKAIAQNMEAARTSGINPVFYRIANFTTSCTLAGFLGGFYAHYYGALAPGSFGPFKTIYVHVYAILGGISFPILGPVIGSLIMTFVPEFLRITEGVEPIITGILIILLVMFLPNGLLGLSRYWRRGEKASQQSTLPVK